MVRKAWNEIDIGVGTMMSRDVRRMKGSNSKAGLELAALILS
jgi:hypothetical protein